MFTAGRAAARRRGSPGGVGAVVAWAEGPGEAAAADGPGAAGRLSGAAYAAVFAAMPTPYLVLTPELVVVDANPAYLSTMGRALEDIVGRDVSEAFPGNPRDVAPDGGVGDGG